jgi:hypothetical protein
MFDHGRIMLTAVNCINELATANRHTKSLDMNRRGLAGVTLLAVVTAGFTGLAAAQPGIKASPPLLFKAKPKAMPVSATKNDALFQRFIEWRKKHSQ